MWNRILIVYFGCSGKRHLVRTERIKQILTMIGE